MRCRACTLIFAHPFVAGDEEFYALAYSNAYTDIANSPEWRWEFQSTFKYIERLVVTGSLHKFRLLEIGAGDGTFVKRISPALTPKENVLCTEFANNGLRAIREHGIKCLPVDIRRMTSSDYGQGFNVICMFQVLEHLSDLSEFFDALRRVSCESARLFVAVPNDIQREFYDCHVMVEDYAPMHISRWNRRALQEIGARHGWTLRLHRNEPLSFAAQAKMLCRYRFKQTRLCQRLNRMLRQNVQEQALWYGATWCFSIFQLPTLILLAMHDIGGRSQWAYFEKKPGELEGA